MIEITPRTPVAEERDMMYRNGFNPSEMLVCYRLNGTMVICSKEDHSDLHKIKEKAVALRG